MKMSPVVHFEMPAKDKTRVAKFYETAFGWKMQQLGADMGSYILATTTETDKNGFPKTPGKINGGFYEYTKKFKEPSVVVAVDNLTASMKLVKKSGGKVLGKPMEIPGIGMFVSIKDTEGNRVGMLQPAPM